MTDEERRLAKVDVAEARSRGYYVILGSFGDRFDARARAASGCLRNSGERIGVVNSDKAIAAFDHYLSLEKYMPPVAKTGQMDIFVVQDLYMQGKVAAIVDWVGVMGPVVNPKLSKVSDRTDFAEPPGTRKPDGSLSGWSKIGGQPFVLTTWNSDDGGSSAVLLVLSTIVVPVEPSLPMFRSLIM